MTYRRYRSGGAAAVLAMGLGLMSGHAPAEPGEWRVRAGIGHVSPQADSEPLPGLAGSSVDVDSASQLVLNVTYFWTERMAVELLGALPFQHEIEGAGSLSGLGEVAEIKHLPPTLSVQYHFGPVGAVRPYLGAGLNYTIFFDEETTGALSGRDIELDDSLGLAAQLGADVRLNGDWFVNGDLRYLDIGTEAEIEGIGSFDVDIDPWVFTLAVGRRF